MVCGLLAWSCKEKWEWVVLLGKESAGILKYKEASYVSGENVAGRVQRFLEHFCEASGSYLYIHNDVSVLSAFFLYLCWAL